MTKLKAAWIKFLCRFNGHSMVVVSEVVDWGYWDRLSRCERCGIPFAEYNYHPPRDGAKHRWIWVA